MGKTYTDRDFVDYSAGSPLRIIDRVFFLRPAFRFIENEHINRRKIQQIITYFDFYNDGSVGYSYYQFIDIIPHKHLKLVDLTNTRGPKIGVITPRKWVRDHLAQFVRS